MSDDYSWQAGGVGILVGIVVFASVPLGLISLFSANDYALNEVSKSWPAWTGPVLGFGTPVLALTLAWFAGVFAAERVEDSIGSSFVAVVGYTLISAVGVALVIAALLAYLTVIAFGFMIGLTALLAVSSK